MSGWDHTLVFALAAGVLLGLLYFGGLWLTVRWLPGAKRPVLWVAASLIVRLGALLAGLYLVMGGQWQRMLAAVAGLILVRTLLVRRFGVPARLIGDRRQSLT